MSAMVRSTATVVNGSLDGILNRLTALTIAPCAIDATHPAGAFPASMCTIRGVNAPQGGYPVQQPDSNLVWGILCTVLCCLPLGIVSIVYASKVSGLWTQGRYAEAQTAADNAKKWAIWGAVAGVIVAIIYVIIGVAGGMANFM
jgi:hypothetical protein